MTSVNYIFIVLNSQHFCVSMIFPVTVLIKFCVKLVLSILSQFSMKISYDAHNPFQNRNFDFSKTIPK